jgi:hypothetical protein
VLIRSRVIDRLREAGPVFSPEFGLIGGEDLDFFIRAQRQGFTIAVAPRSVVYRAWHGDRLTLVGVMRRAFQNGNAIAHIERRHLSAEDRWRRHRRVAKRILRWAASLPRRLLMMLVSQLRHVSTAVGKVYGRCGRRYHFYGRPATSKGVRPPLADSNRVSE